MRLTLISIIPLLMLSSCGKDNLGPKEPSYGKFNAFQNGEKWGQRYPGHYKTIIGQKGISGTAMPCQENFYLINIGIYNNEAFIREKLVFIKLPLTVGMYNVVKFEFECDDNNPAVYSYFSTISDDGDVLQDRYQVLESEDNFIVIDTYDSKTHEIKGTFQVTFVIEKRSTNDPSLLPDTLRFTNGTFNTKILMD